MHSHRHAKNEISTLDLFQQDRCEDHDTLCLLAFEHAQTLVEYVERDHLSMVHHRCPAYSLDRWNYGIEKRLEWPITSGSGWRGSYGDRVRGFIDLAIWYGLPTVRDDPDGGQPRKVVHAGRALLLVEVKTGRPNPIEWIRQVNFYKTFITAEYAVFVPQKTGYEEVLRQNKITPIDASDALGRKTERACS